MTDDEYEVATEARLRRQRQRVIALSWPATLVLIPIAYFAGPSLLAIGSISASYLLILCVIPVLAIPLAVVVTRANWTCPRCSAPLNVSWSLAPGCLRMCESCGARLVVSIEECWRDGDDDAPIHHLAEL